MSITTERVIESLQPCKSCGEMLHVGAFDKHSQTGRLRNTCRVCRLKQISNWQTANREQTRTNQRKYNRTFRGRAIILLNAAQARARKNGEAFDLTLDDVMEKLSVGKCAKTGVAFEYENTVGGTQSPYAPSLDKINPNDIYTPLNVQIVSFWFNAAKQQWSEHVTIEMCRRVTEINK